jgi:glycosyltransferase involved in cell wall biosynthesis
MQPLVSVILTIYNEEEHIEESLQSLLAQTYQPVEVIVVDDGSTDSSKAISYQLKVNSKYVRYVYQKHKGLGSARNRGVQEAKGKIVIFCDADLIYDSGYVKKLVSPILEKKCIGTLHADELVKNPDNFWSHCWQINDGLPLDRRLPFGLPEWSTFFRAIDRQAFLQARGFDEIGYLDDRSLYPKLQKKALVVKGAICWHYNPSAGREVFREAVWHGKSLARQNLPMTALQFSFINTIRRILIDTYQYRYPGYFLFKIIFDYGINVGVLKFITKANLKK